MVVYPHWRGELEPCQNGASFVPGLSPLPRGTHLLIVPGRKRSRFIPAGAGNSITWVRGTLAIAAAVYPRWRGELQRFGNQWKELRGLSPLARGTLLQNHLLWDCQRFIPAGAGNSFVISNESDSWSVYPRWRGELEWSIAWRSA